MLNAVTELPDAAVLVTAGLVPGLPPDGNTKTSNADPEAGAGVHWYAQPMFHCPLPTVKGVLVQLPLETGVGPSRTCTEPDAAGTEAAVEVVLPVADVVADEGATVVDEDVVLVALRVDEPLGTGSV